MPDFRPGLRLLQACLAEAVGTYLMVTIGTGAVAASELSGAHVGLWQVAVVWGLGVTLAIYVTAAISGAHLNPAVSLAFAIFRRQEFPFRRLAPYWTSQLGGAVLAGITVLTLYGPLVRRFEDLHRLERGEPGSQLSAMIFGEYFPHPVLVGTDEAARALVSPAGAALVEGFGTGILVLVIFALIDRRNTSLPLKFLSPVFIGATIAVIISVLAPLPWEAGTRPGISGPASSPSSPVGGAWRFLGRPPGFGSTSRDPWLADRWARRYTL
jgi:glycerol uptake facilitator-like aquaporin